MTSLNGPKQGTPEPIAALNRVKILEKGLPWQECEALVDVRAHCPDVVWQEKICPYLRRTVADMVNRAQASLPAGYRLNSGTALRTLTMQARGWDGFYKKNQEAHPEWPISALCRTTNKYFAPYDQPAPPGHCTGGAIDVGLLDSDGKSLDMIAPTEGWQAAYTWSDLIGDEAKRNRMMMVEAMLGAGFSNCRDEYWHYSYGDSAWAVRVGEKSCPYGWAYPPVALEAVLGVPAPISMRMGTDRDIRGKAVSAEGAFTLENSASEWQIGLYWGDGVPLVLQLNGAGSESLFHSTDHEAWNPLEVFDRTSKGLKISLTPTADRVWISNYIPPKPEPEAAK